MQPVRAAAPPYMKAIASLRAAIHVQQTKRDSSMLSIEPSGPLAYIQVVLPLKVGSLAFCFFFLCRIIILFPSAINGRSRSRVVSRQSIQAGNALGIPEAE